MVVETKICRLCQKPTPLDKCVRNSTSKDGRANLCLPCARAQSKAAYARSKMTRKQRQEKAQQTRPCIWCGEQIVGASHRVWESRENGNLCEVHACLACWEVAPEIAQRWLMWLVWTNQVQMEPSLHSAVYQSAGELNYDQ